jgi:hypothetical protein
MVQTFSRTVEVYEAIRKINLFMGNDTESLGSGKKVTSLNCSCVSANET